MDEKQRNRKHAKPFMNMMMMMMDQKQKDRHAHGIFFLSIRIFKFHGIVNI